MNSTERVKRAITGQAVDRTPMYGWLSANLTDELTRACGSVAAFEDKYEFDAAHIFGGPSTFNKEEIQKLRDVGEEITPETLLDIPFMPVDRMEDYENVRRALAFHKQRGRFCYVQTPGFFEQFNDPLGIENQLMDLALYPDELMELYTRQAEWTKRFASNMLDLGVDMIHVSDDWGSQRSMLFSPRMWREMIYPNLKAVADFVHARGAWQCGTIQLDMNLPERFDLTYTGPDGEKHRPVMIHRVVFGSIERFIGILTEHFAGAFPLWLSPVQAKIMTITDRADDAARALQQKLEKAGIRTEIDLRNEKIGFKIREARNMKIPYLLVLGDREAQEGTVSVTLRGGNDLGSMPVDALIARMRQEIETKVR